MDNEKLYYDLVMMITSKLIDHAIKDNSVDMMHGGGKLCPNAFKPFTNLNPAMLAQCIVDGEETWGEYWNKYLKEKS